MRVNVGCILYVSYVVQNYKISLFSPLFKHALTFSYIRKSNQPEINYEQIDAVLYCPMLNSTGL